MRAYSHFIWDFDGTLVDRYPHSTAAMCAAAARFGISVDPAQVSRWLRRSFQTCIEALRLTEAQVAVFRRYHGDMTLPPPIVPFPDAAPTLAALSARGARHYLYTHSRRRMSVAFLERFALLPAFDDCMTPDDPAFTPKPDPGALRALLARHAIDPADAVMVGDREIDMVSARGAGIDGILVDPDRLVPETCAVLRVDTLAQIAEADARMGRRA